MARLPAARAAHDGHRGVHICPTGAGKVGGARNEGSAGPPHEGPHSAPKGKRGKGTSRKGQHQGSHEAASGSKGVRVLFQGRVREEG
jgi:hypothetical protein